VTRLSRSRVWIGALVLSAGGVLALLALPGTGTGPTEAVAAPPPCLEGDVLTPLASSTLKSHQRQLVLRQSGGQDKVFFLELYPADTRFDACRRGTPAAVDTLVVERRQRGLRAITIEKDRLVLDLDGRGAADAPAAETDWPGVPVHLRP
jgi:hypothetical protein